MSRKLKIYYVRVHRDNHIERFIMRYKVYRGPEIYGRDLSRINHVVLFCKDCGMIGTFESMDKLEEAKLLHEKSVHSDSNEEVKRGESQ